MLDVKKVRYVENGQSMCADVGVAAFQKFGTFLWGGTGVLICSSPDALSHRVIDLSARPDLLRAPSLLLLLLP